jgi:hypothetical protein
MSTSPLSIDVYVAPMRRYNFPGQLGEGEVATWAPSSVGAADLPENLAASQQYVRDFSTVAKKGGTVEDLVHDILELHSERDQPHTLWISARAEVARRA